MRVKNPQSTFVRSAWATLVKATEKVERVEKALGSVAIPEVDEAAVLLCRERVEDLLASRAIGDASEAEEQRAKSALRVAQSTFEQSKSARSEKVLERDGLSRHLIAAKECLRDAEMGFKEAQRAWAFEELEAADVAYTSAVAEVVQHFRRAHSCGKLLRMLTNERNGPLSSIASRDIKLPVLGRSSNAVSLQFRISDGYFQPGTFVCTENDAMRATGPEDLMNELAALR